MARWGTISDKEATQVSRGLLGWVSNAFRIGDRLKLITLDSSFRPKLVVAGGATVGETTDAGLIQYGTSATPIVYTPTSAGSHSGIQMHITAEDAPTGLSLAAVRAYVTYTGTAKATAYGGLFWVNLNTTLYTGDYLGGTPAGVQGVIQIEGTVNTTNDHAWYAGVVGEVRPLGTVTQVGVISGVRAVLNCDNSTISSGVVVGVHVGAYNGTVDTGVLVLPHEGSTFTTGLHLDSQYGTITTGITIGICTTALSIDGGTSEGTVTTGSAIRIGSFSTPLALNTAGQKGIAAYFSSTATTGGLTGMRLRTRGNAASGTATVTSFVCQADVIAAKYAQDVGAARFEAIAKLGAVLGSAGRFEAASFKVEDEEATGTSGANITYGGYVTAIRLMSQISADPSNEHCMIYTHAMTAAYGSSQSLDALISIESGGKNMDTLALFHWLGASGVKTSGNYALVLSDGACNESAWTGSNEKGYISINISGTYYQIPFFASS